MEERILAGNAPLALDQSTPAWRLTSGRAQVFAVVESDSPVRFPLLAVEEGQLAFAPPSDTGIRMVLVGLEEGTTAVAIPLGSGGGDDPARPDGLGSLLTAMGSWAERLAQTVAEPSPVQGQAVNPTAPLALDEGEVVWGARHTVWITSSSGPAALELFGDSPFQDAPGGPGASGVEGELALPLPPAAWVRAGQPAEVAVVGAPETLDPTAVWRGFEAFQRAALHRLRGQLDRRRAEEEAALERQEEEEKHLGERLYTGLAAVLESPGRRLQRREVGDPVFEALREVASSIGVAILEPEHAHATTGIDRVSEIAQASGVRWRRVTLEGRWWRQDVGALYGNLVDGSPVALVPRRSGVIEVVNPVDGTRRRVDAKLAQEIDVDAVVLYRPLPAGEISGSDILRFIRRSAGADIWRFLLLGLFVGLVSLVVPLVTKYIFSTVVPEHHSGVLIGLTILLVAFATGSFGFSVVQRQAVARMGGHVTTDLQAALWDRVLDLPLGFFRRYSSGSLASRVMAVDQIQQLATVTVTTSLLALPIGLCNLVLAFVLEARLAAFGLVVLLLMSGVIVWFTRSQARHLSLMTEAAQSSFGTAMQMVDGVGKLRVAHAEQRAFAQWATRFTTMKEAFVASQRGFSLVTGLAASATAVVTLALFLAAATLPVGSVSPATFIAFTSAFGAVLAAVVGLIGVAVFVAQAKPLYASARPVITTAREVTAGGIHPGPLTGAIEVSHITVRYAPDAPAVLDDVSFTVDPGDFIALVGRSGSGKSTVMRVLLGFEHPELGSVRYDGKDLESLDVREVRRQIGVVTQSVRLLPGDIFTNIVGNRELTMDDAWEAAEIAGMAEDIRAMPMGMHTFVSEGASTFSGGQRQRLLIARAVAAKPRLLLFDEATSALDNRTQAEVSKALNNLRAARVVIAHRLSTIRSADRILVLDGGRIVQSGSFGELTSSPGPFAILARRQLA